MLIVFEGIDGTGKSTQAKNLANYYENSGHEVILSREPTDQPHGKILRQSAETGRLSPEDEFQTFLKDRRQHVTELIAPALAQNKIVILDRYYFSSMAYQGIRGLDINRIRSENETFAPVPDILFILDIEVDAAIRRIGNRSNGTNQFEQRTALAKCREIFLSLSKEPFAHTISANAPTDVVAATIREIATRQ